MIKVYYEGQAYGYARDFAGEYWYHIGGKNDNIIVPVTLAKELVLTAHSNGIGNFSPKVGKTKRLNTTRNIQRYINNRIPGAIYISLNSLKENI